MKLLHVDSSIQGEPSASRALTARIVSRWQAAMPDLEVTHVDLAAVEIPHLSGRSLARAGTEASRYDRALADFLEADVIVVGAPMYNFTVPTQLKAWIDRILVAGQTFRYTETGPVGLAGGKRVIVAVSMGGLYPQGAPGEYVEAYLRHLFAFIGIAEVAVVRADGLAISAQSRRKGLDAALSSIPAPQPLTA